jgi:hypothetical protein
MWKCGDSEACARGKRRADAWSATPRKAETRVRWSPDVEICERAVFVADETTERPVQEERRNVMAACTLRMRESSSRSPSVKEICLTTSPA